MATPFQVAAPEPFDCSKSEEWARWSRRFDKFRTASGLGEKSGASQVNTLVYYMGDSADDVLESFGLSEEELQDYQTVRARFDSYFTKNNLRESYIQLSSTRRRGACGNLHHSAAQTSG